MLTLRDLFQVVFEMRKKELEAAKADEKSAEKEDKKDAKEAEVRVGMSVVIDTCDCGVLIFILPFVCVEKERRR